MLADYLCFFQVILILSFEGEASAQLNATGISGIDLVNVSLIQWHMRLTEQLKIAKNYFLFCASDQVQGLGLVLTVKHGIIHMHCMLEKSRI